MSDLRDDIQQLGAELRETFAAEREAITTLDHARLERIAETKRDLAARLRQLVVSAKQDPEARALFTAIRIEAHATAVLAVVATTAVHAMLGNDVSEQHYDHQARRINPGSSKIHTAL